MLRPLVNKELDIHIIAFKLLTLRFPFVVKALPQMVHANGFSPVWVRSWIWRALAEEKFLPQVVQICCLAVRRWGGTRRGGTLGDNAGGVIKWLVLMGRSLDISIFMRAGGALINDGWMLLRPEEQKRIRICRYVAYTTSVIKILHAQFYYWKQITEWIWTGHTENRKQLMEMKIIRNLWGEDLGCIYIILDVQP